MTAQTTTPTGLTTVGARNAKRVHLAGPQLNEFGQWLVLCGGLVPYQTAEATGPATCTRCLKLAAQR